MMAQFDPADRQASIAAEMHIAAEFDANREIERRVDFLAHYLRSSHLKTYVLGISGGVDSTTAGRLAQLAVERLRANHYNARFVAVRLPYGKQRDEADAQQALRATGTAFHSRRRKCDYRYQAGRRCDARVAR
ncbi:PP-loop superfamily ATP-utilizing enzyme [Paraburkholderia sp. WC7.3g]